MAPFNTTGGRQAGGRAGRETPPPCPRGGIHWVYKLITSGLLGRWEHLLSNRPDRPSPPWPLPAVTPPPDFAALPSGAHEQGPIATRTEHFGKRVPVFSSTGPTPGTQANQTRANKPKKAFLRNNTGGRKWCRSGPVLLARSLAPTCRNQPRASAGTAGCRAPQREGTLARMAVWLGSSPGAKFRVQFPVISRAFPRGG